MSTSARTQKVTNYYSVMKQQTKMKPDFECALQMPSSSDAGGLEIDHLTDIL